MGKTNTSTSQVSVPPEVLAQYSAVNAKANQTASTPFQTYSGQFVAPINSTQQAGITGTTAAANQAQPYYTSALGELNTAQSATTPYYGAATTDVNNATTAGNGLAAASLGSLNGATAAAAPLQSSAASGINSALAGAQPYQAGATGYAVAGGQAVNPTTLDASAIDQYLSPYLNTVLGSESALLNQNNQQQQAGQLGNAITSGAFGGDRAGIAAANLEQQQNLANANIYGNILNTGYNNALSTAQQQQGVGLAAGQANRAALQTTSGELQGIGEQGFEQGLGAAGAQGALGQQEYAQGANTAAQEAALGQQQFGQGLAASNQNAALAGDIYGTGAATSAATAGLGAGAQSAALQGSQAELAAGTAAQQTQQAQDTAQYNQFLQQQSYPFQVDQFLANIAEGTGALSGSTTTTTAPGGLFSDERLKEDIQPIGKTFDGQNIIKFRYKGDKKTQIGLSAQETEHHHPDAVGLASGYKTVDYDKATRKAAQRGRFRSGGLATAEDWREGYAYGGVPMLPGMSYGDLMALEQQQQMYAPFSQTGGLYGGPSGGAPRGGSSYVPQANLPVSHLAVAQTQARPNNTLQQITDMAKLASNPLVDKAASGLGGLFQGASPPQGSPLGLSINDNPTNDNVDDVPYARGGLAAGRRGYDTGGAPYADQIGMGLDIPDDNQHPQLAVAQPPGQNGSGALGDLAGIAGLIAKLIPAARGGAIRKGYDDGGSPTNDNIDDGTGSSLIGSLESGAGDTANFIANLIRAQNLTEPEAAKAAATHPLADNSMPSGSVRFPISPADATQAPSPVAVSAPRIPPSGGGGGSLADIPSGLARMVNAPIADNAPSMAGTMQGLGAVTPPPDTETAAGPTLSQPAPISGTGLASAAPVANHLHQSVAANDTSTSSPSSGTNLPSGIEQGVQGALGKVGGFLSDPKNIPSVLTGLAAMFAAPTKYPLVALTQGLGAGAQSYLSSQQQRANIARTQAEVGQTQAQAYTAAQRTAPEGMQIVPGVGPDGKSFSGPDGKPAHYALKVGYADFGSTPGAGTAADVGPKRPPVAVNYQTGTVNILPSSDTDAFVKQQYGIDPSLPGVANHARMIATNPALAQTEAAAQASATARIGDQAATDATHRQYVQLGEAINSLSPGGVTGAGAHFEDRVHLANIFHTYASMLGVPDDPGVNQDLNASQIIDKIKGLTGPALANQYGERAASVAHSISSVLPGGNLQGQAANEVLSTMMVQNQQQRDFAPYLTNYVKAYGTPLGAEQSFQRDMGPLYDHEQKILPAMMHRNGSSPSPAEIISSDPSQIKWFENGYKLPNGTVVPGYGQGASRYFR